MIQQLVEPAKKIDYRTLCESLIRTFGTSEPVNWDSSIPVPQQQQLFGGELLRIIADHPTIALQHDIRALCWPKGTVSQLLFLFVRLNDDRLPKTQIERITRRFVGGLEAERYTVWFFGNPSQTMLKVVLAGREGKKTVCKTLTLEAGQWYKTYDFILDTVAKVNAVPAQRDMFSVSEPSVLWKAIWQAFDISIVNKNFYRDIKAAFDSLITSLSNCKGILTKPEQRAQFAVRLLGRLIFCWFLKKKGIVGSNALSSATVSDSINYYRELLEPLFFDVFNTPESTRKAGLPASIATLRFLNGGLFEPQADDCQGNFQLLIPNDWFAGFFGDTMERYNFTVDENSATNAEIAIDPEMLGRIFENLLAEQNPETGASARKQTGSFYTPREIVDYMVEESLIAYLGAEYTDFVHTAELPEKQKPQADKLLEKLNRLKSIDIAVGSGAFPMGMLQKIVILKQALNPKASPYDLKLETIENSIYGVDIQPMAIELSRLRCWLSLIVDEEPDKVQPLPNLDFKFVCADSLIDLGYKAFREQCERRHGLLFLQDFEEKMKALKRIRHDYFDSSHNHTRKQELKQQFKAVQDDILKISLELVRQRLIDGEFTARITGWNPFDDSKAAPFFSPAWMFGIEDGFDISIGNPPYGFRQIHGDSVKKYFKIHYAAAKGSYENYFMFYEAALKLLKLNGILTFIVPVTWLTIPSAKSLRKFVLSNYAIYEISWLKEAAFENASVNTLITLMGKDIGSTTKVKIFDKLETFPSMPDIQRVMNQDEFIENDYYISIFSDSAEANIVNKIRSVSTCLEDWARPCSGYNPYEVGAGVAPDGGLHTKETVKGKPYHSEVKHDSQWKPEIVGRDLSRYHVTISNSRWVKYGPWLAAARDPENFKGKRILVQEITGGADRRIVAAFYDGELYHSRDVIPIKIQDNTPDPFLLLGIINSKLISWYHLKCSPKSQKGLFPKVLVSDLKNLPISLGSSDLQSQIVQSVQQVILAKNANPDADTKFIEAEIDQFVYALYGLTDEEIAVVEGKDGK